MLVMALMLLVGPVDELSTRPFALSQATVTVQAGRAGEVRTGRAVPDLLPNGCAPLMHHAGPQGVSRVVTRSGTFSMTPPEGEPRVKMYHLLERTIDGCRVPVIAIDHLPEADRAIGRNLGRNIIRR